MDQSEPCPCGSSESFTKCCGRWHTGEPAPTAEALMRSRYSAFVLGNERYLLESWHPNTRPKSVSFDSKQKWLGLKIIEAKSTGSATCSDAGSDIGEVEFIARYRIGGGSAARLHERSRFVRESGRWFYVDGHIK